MYAARSTSTKEKKLTSPPSRRSFAKRSPSTVPASRNLRGKRSPNRAVATAPSPERAEHLSARHRGFRVDQHEGHHARGLASIHPAMDGSALHEDIARLEVDLGAFLQLHVDLTRDHHRVVDRVGAMHAGRDPGRELDDAEYRSAGER